MHVSPECDIACWSEDGVSLRSRWDKNVVGMDTWIVDNLVGSGMGVKCGSVWELGKGIVVRRSEVGQ